MRKSLLLILLFFFFLFPVNTYAQTCNDPTVRCAECDACGYCRGRQAPGNWGNCIKCLYPNIDQNSSPEQDQTLIVSGSIGEKARAITPALGRYYTQLGCVDTNLDSFTNPSAAGGLLNFVLNRLIFPAAGVLAFLSLIYGAFLLATAQRNPEQLARGKSYIVGAIVGLLFVFGVVFIVGFIAGDVLKIPWFSKGNSLKIYAAADFVNRTDGSKLYPHMEILLNDELKESFTVSNDQTISFKEYSVSLPPGIPNSNQIKVRFANDYCPRCIGNPNGDTGDINLYVQRVTLNSKDCTPGNYLHEDDGATEPYSFPVIMPYKGPIDCTIN